MNVYLDTTAVLCLMCFICMCFGDAVSGCWWMPQVLDARHCNAQVSVMFPMSLSLMCAFGLNKQVVPCIRRAGQPANAMQ